MIQVRLAPSSSFLRSKQIEDVQKVRNGQLDKILVKIIQLMTCSFQSLAVVLLLYAWLGETDGQNSFFAHCSSRKQSCDRLSKIKRAKLLYHLYFD